MFKTKRVANLEKAVCNLIECNNKKDEKIKMLELKSELLLKGIMTLAEGKKPSKKKDKPKRTYKKRKKA